ncbi:Ribokinase-like protein [Russula earlei]|uniref:Ribokinase-like protein n=1 Tax=Russula earlei TaxID=71964 RepID=A0ACC0TQ74_9AGAM|nr:Ribokinase-like protein [Russula earlei]
MLLLSPQQIQQWDAYTILHEPISSIDLMERAARHCVDWIISNDHIRTSIKIFCGKGNNGGDGLAIARLLLQQQIPATVYILEFGAKGTDDFQLNLQRLHSLTKDIHFIQSPDFFPPVGKEDLVIDALFGSGLNRPLQDLNAAIVQHINQSGARIIAIDVPSGLFLDKSAKGNPVVTANYTLTFQSLKLCLMVAENARYFGEVAVLDIGLHPLFLQETEATFSLLSKEEIARGIKPRPGFSHKGTYGHALLIAGNTGKMGAALLAAKACLRSGVGLLTVNVPKNELPILQTSLHEAMATIREEEDHSYDGYASIGIGPGIGTAGSSEAIVRNLLENYAKPVVWDADAVTILGKNKQWLEQLSPGSILTPHPKEFERLFGASDNDFDRLNKAIELSKQYPLVIVLKGHYTLIAFNGKGWFNTTGNAGMAKGGSGDMLTGMLTALLAQGYTPLQATVTGVYLHGLSADLTLEEQSMESMLPSDTIENIGKAFLFLKE